MENIFSPASLFDLTKTIAAPLFEGREYAWEVLDDIEEFIAAVGPILPPDEYDHVGDLVWIAKDAEIFRNAYIGSPCIIDKGAQLRCSAFLRGNVIVGRHAVVGNSTELKNSILFDYVETPHFNYVGDSILGFHAHMGAGAITSNVKADRGLVVVHGKTDIPTGRKKFGAVLGDYAEIGCNTVLNPGTVVGPRSIVYPLSSVRGVIPPSSIYKSPGTIIPRK